MGTPMKAAMLVALTAYGAAVPVTPEHTLQPGLTDSSNATSGSVVDRSSTATATTAAATTVAAASYQGTCPPQGWERCGNQWPPLFNYYCCATSGYMGTSPLHCDKDQGGINALEHCCERFEPHGDVPGYLSCKSECEPPPADCTGDPAIDKILLEADVGCKIGLTKMNAVYTWQGFCDAVKYFNDLGDRTLYLGQNEADGLQTGAGLSNIAALLAQCMWESGGEAPFTACDENNYRQTENAACTQRADGARYDSLNDEPWACDVDPNMHMVAETFASWAQLGPMTCKPNSVTEGCCWWGRGAIQTTGPNNYGLLNKEIIKKIPKFQNEGVDICKNPEAMCQYDETKWLGAIFYWANNVQGYTWPSQKSKFYESLTKFVESDYDLPSSLVEGADFASGTGNVVNNGFWKSQSHGHHWRILYFNRIMHEFKQSGMVPPASPPPPSPPSYPPGYIFPPPSPPSPPSPPPSSPPPCYDQPLEGAWSTYTCATYEAMSCPGVAYNRLCGYCDHATIKANCCRCKLPEDAAAPPPPPSLPPSPPHVPPPPSHPPASDDSNGTPTTGSNGCTNAPWDQCGGQGFTGQTCCPTNHACNGGAYWKQCEPAYGDNGCSSTREWAQCGGDGYTGETCCPAATPNCGGGQWYKQCKP